MTYDRLHEGSKMKHTSTILAIFLSIIILIFPVSYLWLLAAFSNLILHFLVPLISIVLIFVIGFITFSISNKIFYKKTIISLSILVLILFGAVVSEYIYKFKYIPSITVEQRIYYKDYMPFTDSNKLARLDCESTLHFSKEENLPVIDGATALFPVYCSFAEAVYPSDCEIKEYVKFNNTIGSYKALIEGKDDIIFAAQPSKEQIEKAKEAGIEFNLYPIGYEAFVFIVNQKNPVSNLTLNQIKEIYTGKITNWKEVDGKDQVIRPFQRDTDSGSQTAFISVMGKDVELIPPEIHQVNGMEGLVDVVSDYENHSNAIGYSFRYYIKNMNNNVDIKVLKLNGIEPTRETIRNKTYPITDNFYAVTVKGKETENTKKFIDWILSNQGQKIIDKVGYVSLTFENN